MHRVNASQYISIVVVFLSQSKLRWLRMRFRKFYNHRACSISAIISTISKSQTEANYISLCCIYMYLSTFYLRGLYLYVNSKDQSDTKNEVFANSFVQFRVADLRKLNPRGGPGV